MRSYNNTPQPSIGMAPLRVNAKNQEKVWQRLYGHDGKAVPKLCVSDRVRVSKYKGTFEKAEFESVLEIDKNRNIIYDY